MKILHHDYNDTDISLPNVINEEFPHVIEVGHSFPVIGYKSSKLYRKNYVIHYIISGKGKYQGNNIEGPCAFLETPKNVHYYSVTDDPTYPQWEQYWIMFSGPNIEKWLQKAKLPLIPTVFPCPYIAEAAMVLKKLQTPSNYTNQSDSFYMLAGLIELFSLHRRSQNKRPPHKRSTEHVRIVCSYIHDNYPEIKSVDELAQIIHVSARHLDKLFRSEMGISPISYLNTYRINQAKLFLTTTDYSITEISEMVGFSNGNYFCTAFQKHCNGLSPSAYRKKNSRLQ
ncbi:MAG: helix-turn-helix domain-containing protein [Clostridia bacterium]|nr:helix-turn-helix domain-containing protein [Clostridia bacterium]